MDEETVTLTSIETLKLVNTMFQMGVDSVLSLLEKAINDEHISNIANFLKTFYREKPFAKLEDVNEVIKDLKEFSKKFN